MKRFQTITSISVLIGIILSLFTGCTQIKDIPAETEDKCNFIPASDNNDALKLEKESEHFKFYCRENDISYINDLSEILEKNYERITKDLKVDIKDKIDIEIYRDMNEVTEASGVRSIGIAKDGKIRMVSPSSTNIDLMRVVIVHEFTHMAVNNINSSLYPYIWLSEGTAAYEAGGPPIESTRKQIIMQMVKSGDIVTLDDLNTVHYKSDTLYACAYTMIEFIVKEFGYDKLIALIQSPSDMKNILDLTEDELYIKWTDYIKNYK